VSEACAARRLLFAGQPWRVVPMSRSRWWVAALAALPLLGVVACTGEPDAQPRDQRAFVEVACPDAISTLVVAPATCGYLTVPVDRAADGATIRLFVTRVPAPESGAGTAPIFVAGTDVGDVPNLSGIAPMAQRTGREVIVLQPRGTGLSTPTLDCPELPALSADVLAARTTDPKVRETYFAAVSSCHHRLVTAGIDPDHYGVAAMAADAEDLRRALGVESWDVVSFGTSSRIALQLLRTAPEHVRSLLLDSPEWPGLDPRAAATAATDEALTAVLDACAQDDGCRTAAPPERDPVAVALDRLEAAPVTVAARAPGGGSTPVLVDAGRLLQVLRHQLTGDSVGGLYRAEGVPVLLSAVLDGRTEELALLADALVGDEPFCNGYVTRCSRDGRGVSGVDLTVLCRDIAPFVAEPERSPGRSPGRSGFAAAFDDSPYWAVCASWPVTPAGADVAAPVVSDVPVLAMVGAFNPSVRPGALRAGAARARSADRLVDPAGGSNVMPRTDCMLELRQRFLDDPEAPLTADCLASVRPTWPKTLD
jgi:pimeloyl-ACP methyl ester carboxylesterase